MDDADRAMLRRTHLNPIAMTATARMWRRWMRE